MNIKQVVIAAISVIALAGCTTLTNLTPEESAALQAKQRAGKVDQVSFDQLKEELAVVNIEDPQ